MNSKIFTVTNFFCSFLKGSQTFDFVSILPDDQLQEIMEDPLLAKYATNVLDSFIKIGDMQTKLKKKSDDQFLDDMKVAGYFHPRTLQP